MRSLYILLFSLLSKSSVTIKNGNFYLTFWNESELTVLNAGSPINTVGLQWAARSYYNNSYNSTGWDILEITTNPDLPDEDQAYQAGWIEGFLTQEQIYCHWYNTQSQLCQNDSLTCKKVSEYLSKNWLWIKSKIGAVGADDPYWYQVKLYYHQIRGLHDGYMNATKDASRNLSYNDILMLNFLTDILTLVDELGIESEENRANKEGHCSVLIKLLPGFSEVFIGHNTWLWYTFMNRLIKRYNFAYHWSANSTKLIPGQYQSFSSYAGVISSTDDFYIIKSGLVVTETSLNILNKIVYTHNIPNGQVMESVRVVVANRLANDTQSWSHYFSVMNSGTYNDQWMIIDLKKFRPGFEPERGFFHVLEQMPGLIVSNDQTQHIISHSYWASYNIPFYKNIYDYAGYDKLEKEYGPYFSYTRSERAKLFERDQAKVVDLDSMLRVMRFNHYETDPYSICVNCTPDHNACMSISSRCDLNPKNGSYYPNSYGFSLFGAIDAKIGSYTMFKKGEMIAVSGPTTSGGVLPPFRWSTATDGNSTPHIGQPDLWDFAPILTSWIHPYTQADPKDKVVTIFHTPSKRNEI